MKLFSSSSTLVYPFFALLCSIIFMQACGVDNNRIDFSNSPPPYDISQAVRDTTLPGNIKIYVIKEGSGPFKVVSSDQIRVHFTGRTENGKIFDGTYLKLRDLSRESRNLSNLTPNPINTSSGTIPPLVKGFRKGLLGMKVGEKRVIIVPPDMGYNDANPGVNGKDLRDKTLTYDVELLNIL